MEKGKPLSAVARNLVNEPIAATEERFLRETAAMDEHLKACPQCGLGVDSEKWCEDGLLQAQRAYLTGLIVAGKAERNRPHAAKSASLLVRIGE